MENKRAWWVWRPADARSNAIDDRILLGIWLVVALLGYIGIVVWYVLGRPIAYIGPSLLILPVALIGASPMIRRMNNRR